MRALLILAAVCAAPLFVSPLFAEEPEAKKVEPPAREFLEKQFAEKMSGATLVGFYTIAGQEEKNGLRAERYTLSEVKKAEASGDLWTFIYQYGEKGPKIPLTLEMHWVGDTPMITLTDLTIPGLGTFSARVLFYGDRYAGTWQHDDKGGHLFGTIEPKEKREKEANGE